MTSPQDNSSLRIFLPEQAAFQPGRLPPPAVGQRVRSNSRESPTSALGARLLYQIRREFAPYLGVTWSRKIGETAHKIDQSGGDIDSAAWVAGVRFWF